MTEKVCSILGESQIPPESREIFREKLKEELQVALQAGYTYFWVPYEGDLGPLCAEVLSALRAETPHLIIEAVFPRGLHVSTGEKLPYDSVAYYDRKQSDEYDLSRYMVAQSRRSIFLYKGERHLTELVALNYAELLKHELQLAII